MKQFFKMFFASLLAMVVAGVILIIVLVSVVANLFSKATRTAAVTPVSKGSVLYLDLGERLHEQGEKNSLALLDDGDGTRPGVYDFVRALRKAKSDDDIRGLFIRLNSPANTWATLEQMNEAIADFRSSGKFVYGYGDVITQKAYYTGAVADKVFLNPVGVLELKGLSADYMFFKGALDKLEVEPEIYYAGKFKSATEPFRAYEMSPANKEQVSTYMNQLWGSFLVNAAKHAKTDTGAIFDLARRGAVEQAEDALKYKLVDRLTYFDQVEQEIRLRTGQNDTAKIEYVTVDKYVQGLTTTTSGDGRIAVIYAEGDIADGEQSGDYQIASETFVKTIREVRNNKSVKAVVLRVNSPGGSALASEIILRELNLMKKEKPLIVSMGDVAASGGYYIACQADSIFAMPTTITGSIGVFSILFNSSQLLKNKLGITTDGVKNAPYADFPTVTRPLTAEEGAKMQRGIDHIYDIFKSRVAQGRRMTVEQVDSIAQGRVWTGTDALRIGLVDKLGNLDRAIASAAAKANLKSWDIRSYPDRVDRLESLIRRMKNGGIASSMIKADLEKTFNADLDWMRQLKLLQLMNGRAWMGMPYSLNIR